MSPLTPTGSWSSTTSDAGVTETVPLTDEWSGDYTPVVIAATRDDVREAIERLDDLPSLVGHVPVEIKAMLTALIHERGVAAAFLLRALRSLDLEART